MVQDAQRAHSALHIPRLGRWWWLILAFWIFLGFVIANQIFWSMPGHGHDWWRIFLWQAGAGAAWTPLVPLVFALATRFPVGRSRRHLAAHGAAALTLAALHLVAVALLSLALDPYQPVVASTSFAHEYAFMARRWLGQDLIIYVALLALSAILEAREAQEERRIRDSRLQAQLAQAQLRALRLELQPHFIFNALNSVVALMRRGDVDEAEEMLIGLSELLRRTLDGRERQLVPLKEETRLAELYLDIQKIRFADRLDVELDVAAGTEQALVPSLLLQPLIENAVQHGVARRAEGGRVRVASGRLSSNGDGSDRLLLRVVDDGPGPEQDSAEAKSPERPGEARGVGLANARSRLEALYGDSWSLDLGPGPDGGAEVSIRIPWRSAE